MGLCRLLPEFVRDVMGLCRLFTLSDLAMDCKTCKDSNPLKDSDALYL